MDITYRCLECGSDDIVVQVDYNMKYRKVVGASLDNGQVCWCNNCKKSTTFGWIDKASILKRQEGEKK